MTPKIFIIGAGGFGREVHQYLLDLGEASHSLAFLDDNPSALEGFGLESPIAGPIVGHQPQADCQYVIALGNPLARARIAQAFATARWVSIVHPRAYVPSSATLGQGVVLCPGVVVGPHVRIGNHTVLNVLVNVGHDSVVGACAVLSPHSVCNGGVELGDAAFLGTGALVLPRVKVGAKAKVSAGSVAYHDVPEGNLAMGNPARSRPLPPEDA